MVGWRLRGLIVVLQKMLVLTLLVASAAAKFTPHLADHEHLPLAVQRLQGDALADFVNARAGWKAVASNHLTDMTLEEKQNLMGVHDLPQELQHLVVDKEEEVGLTADELPKEFDAREHWPDCVSVKHIRDQANCGSCWAFAAAEAMSDRVCVASAGKVQVNISSEDLLSCCSTCGYGCRGGYPYMAWSYFWWNGIVTGEDYGTDYGCRAYSIKPCALYENHKCSGSAQTPKCVKKCDTDRLVYQDEKHKGQRAYRLTNSEEKIRADILAHGPVEAAFTVYEDFMHYAGGVYEHTAGRYLGGHAVKILGWGEQNGKKYWLVANSWTEKWGEKGFFKILRGTNHCGFEGGVVAGIPVV